jgi:hypothetical protein
VGLQQKEGWKFKLETRGIKERQTRRGRRQDLRKIFPRVSFAMTWNYIYERVDNTCFKQIHLIGTAMLQKSLPVFFPLELHEDSCGSLSLATIRPLNAEVPKISKKLKNKIN